MNFEYVEEQDPNKENSQVRENEEPFACLWNGAKYSLNGEVCSPGGKIHRCQMDQQTGLAYWKRTTITCCEKEAYKAESGQDIKDVTNTEQEYILRNEIGPFEVYKDYKNIIDDINTKRPPFFTAYAPPMKWGTWVEIDAHGGPITFTISYRAVANTMVMGKVLYYSPSEWKELEFKNSIEIRTGNAWAPVKVCFKGIPTGSIVKGTIY